MINPSASIVSRNVNGVAVEQRTGDGFVNGTAMCAAHGRDISDWLKTDDTWELVVALADDLGIKPKNRKSGDSVYTRVSATYPDLVIVRRGSPGTGGGTWLHPDLAIQLAQWCNKVFAIQVSRWVREWLTTGQASKETGTKNISTSNAVKLLDELKQSLQVLSEQLEAGHALLKAGNGMVRSLHNAIHNQGSSLNQADRFLKKAQAQIGEMEKALSSFDEGTLMVEQTTITRVIVQRPQDVRKKIEDFLDYLVTLSPEAHRALFLEVPNLTNRERAYGRFSSRTVARYLGLAPGQDRTVSNVMREKGWNE